MANPFDQFDTDNSDNATNPSANPFDKFDTDAEGSSSLLRRGIADPLVGLARGFAVGIPETLTGLADIATLGKFGIGVDQLGEMAGVSKPLEHVFAKGREAFDQYLTPETRQAQQEVSETKGFFPQVGAVLQRPSVLAQVVADSIPGMVGGSLVANLGMKALGKGAVKIAPKLLAEAAGATKVAEGMPAAQKLAIESIDAIKKANTSKAVLTGGLAEIGVTAGQNAEQTRQQTPNDELTAEQAAIISASAVVTGLIGYGSGKFSQYLGLADPQTMIAMAVNRGVPRTAAEGVTWKESVKNFLKTMAKEGLLEELPQSIQEQAAQNIALGKPIDDGVWEAGAMGMLAGMAQGGGAHVIQGLLSKDPHHQEIERQISETDPEGQVKIAPPLEAFNMEGLTANNVVVEPEPVSTVPKLQPGAPEEDVLNSLSQNIEQRAISTDALINLVQTYPAGSPVSNMAQAEIDRRSPVVGAEIQNNIDILSLKNIEIRDVLGSPDKLESYAKKNNILVSEAQKKLETALSGNVVKITDLKEKAVSSQAATRPQNIVSGEVEGVKAQGKEDTIESKFGEVKIKYGLADANDVLTSHDENGVANKNYDQSLQERPANDPTFATRVQERAGSRMKVNLLGMAPTVTDGAPQIYKDMVVEAGNSRAEAIRFTYRMARAGNQEYVAAADKYKKWLADRAESFGFTREQVEAIPEPMLVRERTTEVTDRAKWARETNVPQADKQNQIEIAKRYSSEIDESMLAKLDMGEEGNVAAASNYGFLQALSTKIGSNEARGMNAGQKISSEFAQLVEMSLFQKAFGNIKGGETFIELLAQAQDSEINPLVNSLLASVEPYVKLNSLYANDPNNITPFVIRAVSILKGALKNHKSGKDATIPEQNAVFKQLLQAGLMDTDSSYVKELAIDLEALKRTPKKLREFLKDLARRSYEDIKAQSSPGLFKMEPLAKEEIYETVAKEHQLNEESRQNKIRRLTRNDQGALVKTKSNTGEGGKESGDRGSGETSRGETQKLKTSPAVNYHYIIQVQIPKYADKNGKLKEVKTQGWSDGDAIKNVRGQLARELGVSIQSIPTDKNLYKIISKETGRPADLRASAAAFHGGHKFDKFKLDQETARTGAIAKMKGAQNVDQKYLELAKEPIKNKVALQQMADAAAKKAGYTTEVFHGTTKFILSNETDETGAYRVKPRNLHVFRGGHFGTENQARQHVAAQGYSKKLEGTILRLYMKDDTKLMRSDDIKGGGWDTIVRDARAKGYDGVVYKNEYEPNAPLSDFVENYEKYRAEALSKIPKDIDVMDIDPEIMESLSKGAFQTILFSKSQLWLIARGEIREGGDQNFADSYTLVDSSKVKLADPVTYDEKGQIVPLSERFNKNRPEIFASVTGIDKRLLEQGLKGNKINDQDMAMYEKTLLNRLTSLTKEDFSVVGEDLERVVKSITKKGEFYERSATQIAEGGISGIPADHPRQRRALEANEGLIARSPEIFNPAIIEGIKKKRLAQGAIALLKVEQARVQAKKADLTGRWKSDRTGSYALQNEITVANNRLADIAKTISDIEALVEPALEVDTQAHKTNAEAFELGRKNGYDVIFMKDNYHTLNAFINTTRKQIFVATGGKFTALQLVGHELSHVGVDGHASNLETQALIDKKSPAVKQYWEALNEAAGVKFSESAMLEEFAADLQGGIKENFGVNLDEGLIQQSTVYGMTDMLTNIPKEVDVIARGPTYKEVTKPEIKSAHQQTLDLVVNHDTKPMAFGKSIDEYEKATGKKFPFRELVEALDKKYIEVSYDSSKMSNKNAFADFSDNTIYINTKKFKEGDWKGSKTDTHLESELAFRGVMALVETAETGKPTQDLIRLRSELTSFKQSLAPFLSQASPEATRIYGLISKSGDVRNMMGFMTNSDFAGWLNSIPDYSSAKPGGSFWSRLKDIVLKYVGKITATGRTKLDELSSIMDKYVLLGKGENILAEARRYESPKDFIRATSYRNTSETTVRGGVEVYIFKNNKNETRYEPINLEQAASMGWNLEKSKDILRRITEIQYANPTLETEKGRRDLATLAMYQEKLKKIVQPIMTENQRLTQIWNTAHGVTAKESAARNLAEREAFAEQQKMTQPIVPKEEKVGGTKREITLAKEAAGFSISNIKKTFVVGERPELPVKKGKTGIETLADQNLIPLANHYVKAVNDPEKYGSPKAIKRALVKSIMEMYPKGEGNYILQRAEKYFEVMDAVSETLAERVQPEFKIDSKDEIAAQKEIQREQAWIDRTRAWQSGAQVTAPVVKKPEPKVIDRTEPTNRYILRRNGQEIGSVDMDINGDTIQMHALVLPRKAHLSGVLSNIFRQNPDVQNITMEVNPAVGKVERKATQIMGGYLTTLGGKFNFNLDGKSEYVLNRDDLGTAIDNREEMVVKPETLYNQPKVTQANFGLIDDYFNSQVLSPEDVADVAEERAAERLIKGLKQNIEEEFSTEADVDAVIDEEAASDIVDAQFLNTSVAWHKVVLPRTSKDLERMIDGDWFRNPTNMPEAEGKRMRNVLSNYGGIAWPKLREWLSLPYQNALKSVDWKSIYKIFGVDRIENRERMSHEWFQKAEMYLNRRHYYKAENYTKKQMKEADYNIGRVLTIGDENLRNIMFGIQDQVKELDAEIKQSGPLFDNSALENKKAALEAEIKRYQDDRAYSFEEVQDGVEDWDGKKIKLNKLEYGMYRAARSTEDQIFAKILEHHKKMLFKQYQKQKWYKILSAALGSDLSEEDSQKIIDKLQLASGNKSIEKVTKKQVAVKLQNIFKQIDKSFKEKDKSFEQWDVLNTYKEISGALNKEFTELRTMISALAPSLTGAELDQAVKEIFVAYQRTLPRLKKLRDLRNNWNNWPGFFPRKRKQGAVKMQMFEEYATAAGVIKKREMFSTMFNSPGEAESIYGDLLDRYGVMVDGKKTLPGKYKFEYPFVSKTAEGSFDGMKDFNLQALLDSAFDNMQASGSQYFDAQGNKVDLKGEVWDAAFDAIAGQFQARGAAAHGIHRKQAVGDKAIKGYLEEEHDQILIDHITAMAGVLTKQEAAYDAMEAMGNLKDKTRAPELRKYISGQLRNDTELDRVSAKLRSLAFLWYLGGMIKSAAVNSTQPIIVGIPLLDRYMREKGIKASGSIAQLNMSRIIAQNPSLITKDPSEWGEMKGVSGWLRRYIDESIISGNMAAQHIRFIKGQTSGWGRVWNKTFDTLATPFAMVEKFNRVSSGSALFEVAFEHYMKNKTTESNETIYEMAKNDANKFINDVHYPIGKHNLPIPAQGGDIASIGMKTAYTFRTFTHNFLLNQFNLLRSAAQYSINPKGNLTAEQQKQVNIQATNDLKTFIHTMALLAMFGGMMGLPFLKDIFDWYEEKFGFSPKEWVRQSLRGVGGETLEVLGMGGIPAFLGGNISGSLAIGVPFMGDQTALESIGGVYAGLAKKIVMAGQAAARGDVYRMSANLTPEFLRGPIVALTESDFGKEVVGSRGIATTPQGMPSYASTGEPLSYKGGEAVLKAVGFQPTRIAKEREIEQSVKKQVMWANEQKKNISESYRIDRIQNNKDALKTMMKDIKELNQKIADRKIPVPRASMSTIIKSSIATKSLQKRRELARRLELAE
jgi:hypothetical protein